MQVLPPQPVLVDEESDEREVGSAKRRLRIVLVVALVVLLLAEIGSRLIEDRITPPEDYGVEPLTAHEDNLEALGGEVDTLFIGSSVVGAGFDATLMSGLGNVYTAWAGGISGRAIDLMSREILVPAADPERVVLVLTSREVNDRGIVDAYDVLRSSPAMKRIDRNGTFLGSLQETIRDHSAFVRIRGAFRQPATLLEDLRNGPDTVITRTGHGLEWLELDGANRYARDHIDLETLALSDFTVGGPELEAVEDLVVWLQAQGIDVAIVNSPVTDYWIDLHTDGAADYQRYLDEVEALAARHGVPLVDTSTETWPEELFADINHLNPRGAQQMAELMSIRLRAALPPLDDES